MSVEVEHQVAIANARPVCGNRAARRDEMRARARRERQIQREIQRLDERISTAVAELPVEPEPTSFIDRIRAKLRG